MTPDPWNLVGWMIVGGVGGLALGAIAQGVSETFDELASTRLGRWALFGLMWAGFGVFLHWQFGWWAVMLQAVLTLLPVMNWIMRQPETPSAKEAEVKE